MWPQKLVAGVKVKAQEWVGLLKLTFIIPFSSHNSRTLWSTNTCQKTWILFTQIINPHDIAQQSRWVYCAHWRTNIFQFFPSEESYNFSAQKYGFKESSKNFLFCFSGVNSTNAALNFSKSAQPINQRFTDCLIPPSLHKRGGKPLQNVFVLFVILDKADNELQLLYRVYCLPRPLL